MLKPGIISFATASGIGNVASGDFSFTYYAEEIGYYQSKGNTYKYRITAYKGAQESAVPFETSQHQDNNSYDADRNWYQNKNVVTWGAVTGADGYRVYRYFYDSEYGLYDNFGSYKQVDGQANTTYEDTGIW
jgi:hypothetical protein